VSGVAHDFNNLLTGIVLCSDLLLAGLEKESRLRRYVQEIRLAGAHGAGLIQQLLAVASERGAETRLVSFNAAITGMLGLLSRLIGEDIELVTDLADDLGMVKMDPTQVQQIILNLVLNARDAMPEGGQITLSTRRRNSGALAGSGGEASLWRTCIEFAVGDTGSGMDAETRDQVFEPFFTTKKPGKGCGLGLSTVHSIVQRGDGMIEVESQLGRGSKVVVRLPGVEAEAGPPGAEPAKRRDATPEFPGTKQPVQHQRRGTQV